MTSRKRIFLLRGVFSGKNPPRKGCFMKFSRGALAAALASVVMTVAPSFGQSARNASNVPPAPTTKVTLPENNNPGGVLYEACDYSKTHQVVTIAIAHGSKDNITGEKIGATLAAILQEKFNTPSKYFVEEGKDYSVVAFCVDGHVYGGYGLKESVSGAVLAAAGYEDRFRGPTTSAKPPISALLGKPEIH